MKYDRIVENQTFMGSAPAGDKFHDSNALGFGWRPGQKHIKTLIKNCTIDANGSSEGLKLSFCWDVDVEGCTIIGGKEDCVDMVRGGRIAFKDCRFISKDTSQHITAKCGIKDLSFKDCVFENDYKNWWDGACIDLGNWGDYDDVHRPKARRISITNCKMENMNRGLLYRTIYSDKPEVENSDGRGLCVPDAFVKLFWFLQRKGWIGERRRWPEAWLKIYDIEL